MNLRLKFTTNFYYILGKIFFIRIKENNMSINYKSEIIRMKKELNVTIVAHFLSTR